MQSSKRAPPASSAAGSFDFADGILSGCIIVPSAVQRRCDYVFLHCSCRLLRVLAVYLLAVHVPGYSTHRHWDDLPHTSSMPRPSDCHAAAADSCRREPGLCVVRAPHSRIRCPHGPAIKRSLPASITTCHPPPIRAAVLVSTRGLTCSVASKSARFAGVLSKASPAVVPFASPPYTVPQRLQKNLLAEDAICLTLGRNALLATKRT